MPLPIPAPEIPLSSGTGDPREERLIECDAAPYLTEVAFPTVRTLVMQAERTFWDKATAVHVFCRQQRRRGGRFSRHWHDLVRLDDADLVATALADRPLAQAVARHKSMFFREKDVTGDWINYDAVVTGELHLVPDGAAYEALADDYSKMLSEGMLLDAAEQFEALMARCADIQEREPTAFTHREQLIPIS